MDRFGDYIRLILNGVFLSKVRRSELAAEILDHLEMAKKELIRAGCSEEESEIGAIRRFGKVDVVKRKFKKTFTPFKMFEDILNRKKFIKEFLKWSATIAGALIISISIRSYAFATTEVRQCSMQNTLFEGQRIIESKIDYYYSAPERGDIVIIDPKAENGILNIFISNAKELFEGFSKKNDDGEKRLIKRVIGTPGDEIDIKDGRVYINGHIYNEPYVKGTTLPNSMDFPITIPQNRLLVLGDNRENSLDSRDIGLISIDRIEGKAVLRIWPIDKFGSVSH
jgi:signal peptidase I